MPLNEEKRILPPIPFLQDRTVLFLDGGFGFVRSYLDGNSKELAYRFEEADFRFLFLPELVRCLSPEMLHYQFPGQEDTILVENLYKNIRQVSEDLEGKTGFLYKLNGSTYFRAIPESAQSDIIAAIDGFIHYLHEQKRPQSKSSTRFRIIEDDDPLDPRTQAIIDAWEDIEREFGITFDDLDVILNYRIKPSRLNITTTNRIFLLDIEGKPEVKLDDLTKALYFFYLRHPAGVAFKELQDYEDEIHRIYMGITGRDDRRGIRMSVKALVAPYSDCRNSCVSRIKKAFRDIVGDRIAKYYYIDGRYADTRIVRIDRDLVIWEH